MQNSWLFPHRPCNVPAFLLRIHSPRLVDTPEFAGWIDGAARAANVRAEWLLMTAQKEQSAIIARSLSQHGRDWLMGFGYTEGPVYSKYRGAQVQVYAAAAGVRGYLTPGSRFDVTGWVGKPHADLDGQTGTIRNLAEACALQYTPHWSTLQTVGRIWREFGFEDGGEVAMRPLAEVARAAKAAPWMIASYAVNSNNQRRPLTTARGYCAAWAGECLAHAFDPAAGINARHSQRTFGFARIADNADHWGDYLDAGGDANLGAWIDSPRVEQLQPGDMLFWRAGVNGYPYSAGHVAIVTGIGGTIMVSENSSSRGIGTHGINAAALRQVADLKRWALPQEAAPANRYVKIVEGLGATPLRVILDARAQVEGDSLRADVRPLLEGLGYRVIADHLADQGKLYIERTEAD